MTEDRPVVTMRRYTRGSRAWGRGGGQFVGYRITCSCGEWGERGLRVNADKRTTERDEVLPHLRDAHGLRGQAARDAIR